MKAGCHSCVVLHKFLADYNKYFGLLFCGGILLSVTFCIIYIYSISSALHVCFLSFVLFLHHQIEILTQKLVASTAAAVAVEKAAEYRELAPSRLREIQVELVLPNSVGSALAPGLG